jgi:hypothetical protein
MKMKTSSLTLVEMAPTPELVYLLLDTLYETNGLYEPEATLEAIQYLESKLVECGLPVALEEYETTIQSPENEQYKRLSLWEESVVDDYYSV